MAKDPVVVALDLGGTNIRLALVNPKGELVYRWERTTASMPDQESFITTLAADLTDCGKKARTRGYEIKAVGLGVPGRILVREGRVAFSPNIPALNDCPLVPLLHDRVKWPIFIQNDANLFALGEHWRGAGAGYREMLGITLGTGVGGGLILNDRLWSGSQGTAGEIGHLTLEPEGEPCHCGNRGCLETLASGFWTAQWVKKELAQGAPSWLRELYEADPEAIQGETLVVAALQRDPLALRAFERVGRSLGTAIASVIHLLGLSRVIIGGRFARAWDVFHLPLAEELRHRLTLFPPEKVSVVPSQLEDDAGLIGAARLAWEGVEGRSA